MQRYFNHVNFDAVALDQRTPRLGRFTWSALVVVMTVLFQWTTAHANEQESHSGKDAMFLPESPLVADEGYSSLRPFNFERGFGQWGLSQGELYIEDLLGSEQREAYAQAQAIRSVGTCPSWNHSATYALSLTEGVLELVLARLNWLCEESILGNNSALECVLPNLAFQSFASLVEVGSFCNESNEHDDQLEVFNKTHAIGQYVGDKLDDELASRATVEQGQQAEDKTGAIQSTLDDYFPVYFPLIEQRQAEQADQVDQQGQQLTDIQARLADLQAQQRLLLARLQDINQRAADIQQENTETRDDTQSIRQGLQAAQGQVQGLDMNLDARVLDNRQLFLAMQLVDLTTGLDINNALPLFQGGRLERVREMVNHALAMAQAAGFDVTAAQARFAQGDTAYNQQQYNTAYHHYAAAYQLITGPELPGGGF